MSERHTSKTDRSVFADSNSKDGFRFHKLFHRLRVAYWTQRKYKSLQYLPCTRTGIPVGQGALLFGSDPAFGH